MNRIFEIAKENQLFRGIAFSDLEKMIGCMSPAIKRYGKGDVILAAGDTADFIGLILSGSAKIKKEDGEGRTAILAELKESEAFGEVFACAGISHSPVTVQAAENAEVMFFDYRKVITSCPSVCPFHAKLIENVLRLVAEKNLMLARRMDIISKRTTRDKLLSFFDAYRGASKKFIIPFDREELAQYLCVDRSAMSNELGRMRRDGLIKFRRNAFELLTPPPGT